MTIIIRAALAVVVVVGCAGRMPVWHDEFDGPAGAPFDRAKWKPDVGGDGFGNQERELYTDGANAVLDGQGHLVITARAESGTGCWYGTCLYTSARLKTKTLFAQAYGRFEARIRIPRGQGIWPAFWLLGANNDEAGWPSCGEIDIMENIGREPNKVHGTVHGPGYSGDKGIGGPATLDGAYADDFHVYAVEWRPDDIRWFVDGREYFRVTPASLPKGAKWVFDHPFFVILNLAIGGGWPGDPDATTKLPQQMVIDYVRVYR
jgi:beta-glucanase (GH16 family)